MGVVWEWGSHYCRSLEFLLTVCNLGTGWYLFFVGTTDPNLSELRRFRAASLPRRKQRRLRRRDAKTVPWPWTAGVRKPQCGGGEATIGSCENFVSEKSILLVKVVEAEKRWKEHDYSRPIVSKTCFCKKTINQFGGVLQSNSFFFGGFRFQKNWTCLTLWNFNRKSRWHFVRESCDDAPPEKIPEASFAGAQIDGSFHGDVFVWGEGTRWAPTIIINGVKWSPCK